VAERPSFFIVGAPKCGTTSMYHYLEQHPQVFLPRQKELNYFADDLFPDYISQRDYMALFAGAGDAVAVGEASVWYLFSSNAARNIHAFDPAARIIVMLRDPVEMLYSKHSQHYFQGMEQEADFARALFRNPAPTPLLDYRAIGRFTHQVARYLELFGPEQVHVILYQDLKADPAAVYRDTLAFLGVDAGFVPDFAVHNANKLPRNAMLRRLSQLPPALLQPLRRLLPFRLRRRLIETVIGWNARYAPRPRLDAGLASRLRAELAPDVRELAGLIGRDLSDWLPQEENTR
jgi:hypothetical protein